MLPKRLLAIAFAAALAAMGGRAARAQWVQTDTSVHSAACFTNLGLILFTITPGGVYLSSDDGMHWVFTGHHGTSGKTIATLGSRLFAAYHGGGQIQESNDSGRTWIEEDIGNMRVNFVGVAEGILLADDESHDVRSLDSGKTWLPLDSEESWHIHAGVSGSVRINTVTGQDGTIYVNGTIMSSDDGASWYVPNPCDSSHIFVPNCSITDKSAVLAGGSKGIYITPVGSQCWRPLGTTLDSMNLYSIAKNDEMLFASTDSGVYLTTDLGTTWKLIGAFNQAPALFVHNGFLFVATHDGSGVWRRPLSDFGISAVSEPQPLAETIHNYPNPFSQSTTISFVSESTGYATVSIVNALGTEVAHLFFGELSPGVHRFTWSDPSVPDGMYVCVVRMNGEVQQARLVLMR